MMAYYSAVQKVFLKKTCRGERKLKWQKRFERDRRSRMWAPILQGLMCVTAIGLFVAGGGLWINSVLEEKDGMNKQLVTPSLTSVGGIVLAKAHLAGTLVGCVLRSKYRRTTLLARVHEFGLHLLQSLTVINSLFWLSNVLATADILLVNNPDFTWVGPTTSTLHKQCAGTLLGFIGTLLLFLANAGATLRARFPPSNVDTSYSMVTPS